MFRVHCYRVSMVALALTGAGCTSPSPFSMPNWADPGPAAYQQRRANRWDTYPESRMGGDMDGARPREFAESNPEATRARWSFWPFSGQ